MWYDPKKRKPLLQLKILQQLAIKGQLTITQTESDFKQKAKTSSNKTRPHYAEIFDAYKSLIQKKLVERRNDSMVKGRPFQITQKGLAVLISECDSENECWMYVIGYHIHNEHRLEFASYLSIDDMLNELRERFLPYKSIGTYSHILDIFKIMSEKLLSEFTQNNIEHFLLNLAKRKEMRKSELESATQEDSSTIKRFIQMLSCDTSSYSDHYTLTGGDDFDIENDRRRYIDFLQHCIIFYHDIHGNRYYYLSLFGIVFLIYLLLLKTNNRIAKKNDHSFQKQIDDIALLYRRKLPLVFDKWHLLRKYLNLQSVNNFGLISFGKDQKKYDEELTNLGFESETENNLAKNIYPMYVSNNIEWQKLLNIGTRIISEISNNNLRDFNITKKVEIEEIKRLLHAWDRLLDFKRGFLNIEISADEIFESVRMHEKKILPFNGVNVFYQEDRLLPLKIIEKAFEDEVTLTYYLNIADSRPYKAQGSFQMNCQSLKKIIESDDKIRDLFKMFIIDASSFHENELKNVNSFADSFQIG